VDVFITYRGATWSRYPFEADSATEARQLRGEVAYLTSQLTQAKAALASLRKRYTEALEQLQLARRRIFVAKAERFDTTSEQLAFDEILRHIALLEKQMAEAEAGVTGVPDLTPPPSQDANTSGDADPVAGPPSGNGKAGAGAGAEGEKKPPKPKGRRSIELLPHPIERVEIRDAELDAGGFFMGFENSWRLGYQPGGQRRILIARAVYKVDEAAVAAQQASGSTPQPDATAESAATATAPAAGTEAAVPDAPAPDDSMPAASEPAADSDVVPAAAVASDAPDHVEAVACGPSEEASEDADAAAADDEAPVESSPELSKDSAATSGVDVTATDDDDDNEPLYFVRAPMPKELIRRSLLAPSMIAHILVGKYVLGVPFFRLERKFEHEGVPISRGLMCRYAEEVGGALGAIVEASRADAIAHAFCLSTDATGILIQPEPHPEKRRQPCRKGHFFVTLADKDYAFFDFVPKHTSRAVWDLFNGYTGFIQADAHTVYDALFAGRAPDGADPPKGPPPTEVGCLAHVRRRFWEAAVSKHRVGLEGVARIKLLYEADERLGKLTPKERTAARLVHVKPLVDRFFAWVKDERAKQGHAHLVADALGYAHRHETALTAFLRDGRLRLDNNRTESAARTVAIGRKAWLFYGSDDHATSGGNLMSLVASCWLHRLDPEKYLTEMIRLVPYWPKSRFLELAPKFWAATRARLNGAQLEREYGVIDVPPPLPAATPATKQQAPPVAADG
jgi:hypothetical protein